MNLFRRRYRVLIDVDVTIHPIDPVRATDLWRKKMDTSAAFQSLGVSRSEYLAHQQRLFDALMRDQHVLDAWLRNEVVRQVTKGEIDDYRDGSISESVLEPAIAEMPLPRRTFFERMRANAALSDALSPLWDSGRCQVLSLDIEHVPLARRRSDRLPKDYRYRASIEVDAGFEQINRYAARLDYRQLRARNWDDPLPDFDEFIDHQIGLAAAVVQHEGALDHWLRDMVTFEIAHGGAAEVHPPVRLRKLLKPVIRGLPTDRSYFLDAARAGVFLASIGAVRDALTSRILFMAMFAPEHLSAVK